MTGAEQHPQKAKSGFGKLWTARRWAPAAAATTFVLLVLASGGASAAGATSSAAAATSLSDYTLATIPGVTSLAVSPSEMFATTSVNCTQVLSVSPSGTVGLYASLPLPASKCGEGSVALAPPCWNVSATDNQWWDGGSNYAGYGGNDHGYGCHGDDSGQSYGPCGCAGANAFDSLWDAQEGKLYQISDHGSQVTLFASFSHTGHDMGLTYDAVGSFDHDLIVTGSSGNVWTVNQTGVVTLVADVGTHIEGPAVAPWSFGAYGGDVLVAAQGANTVYAVSPTGSVTPVVDWKSAESVAFPSNCSCGFGSTPAVFFVANVTSGTIEAFPASDFATLSGVGFVDGESNGGIGFFTSTGVTTTLASHTKHLEQIAFVQCFVAPHHHQAPPPPCGGGGPGYGYGNWWYGGRWSSDHEGQGSSWSTAGWSGQGW